jgi:pimeloyl-ACP methyl ester carboxylesterase
MNMGPAWTVDGKALPFVTPDGMKYRPGAAMKPMFDAALATERRKDVDIPVERIKAPILLISGKEDALWPSFEMGESIKRRLAAANFAYDVQHLGYDGAGHMVFMGNPDSAAAQSMSKAPPNPMMGGTSEAGLAAWKQNWPVTLAFFDKALKDEGQ